MSCTVSVVYNNYDQRMLQEAILPLTVGQPPEGEDPERGGDWKKGGRGGGRGRGTCIYVYCTCTSP